jgi:hypothetical protein
MNLDASKLNILCLCQEHETWISKCLNKWFGVSFDALKLDTLVNARNASTTR